MSCPFPGKEKICALNSTNLRIDSGNLDSHEHLGLNAPPKDRFTFREVLECAPLRSREYTQIAPPADGSTSDVMNVQVLYGGLNWAYRDERAQSNVTFEWPLKGPAELQDYQIQTMVYETGGWLAGNSSTFMPVRELARDNADTWLFFLTANNVAYAQPVDDELFSAHQPKNDYYFTRFPQTALYSSDHVVRVLGCTAQKQWCFGKDRCTPLSGSYPALVSAMNMNSPDMTAMQRFSLYIWATARSGLGTGAIQVVNSLGASALLARISFVGGIQGPLQPDQWQQEVEYWQASTMAITQRIGIEYAAGPSYGPMEKHVQKPYDGELSKHGPPDKIAKRVCQNQKIKSTSHTSFSVLGLYIVFILGGIFILLEQILEPILRLIQRRRNTVFYQRLEWITTETLQLQRMAHEGLGAGTWKGATESVPVTTQDEPLARLDVADKTHPRLVYKAAGERGAKPTNAEDQPHPLPNEIKKSNAAEPDLGPHLNSSSANPVSPLPSPSLPISIPASPASTDEIYRSAMLPLLPPHLAGLQTPEQPSNAFVIRSPSPEMAASRGTAASTPKSFVASKRANARVERRFEGKGRGKGGFEWVEIDGLLV